MERSGQFVKGKSFDSFAPLGPWMVTGDEIAEPQDLDLWLDVNGIKRQRSNTRHMAFGVVALVSYLSQFMTLEPGDVITTGTPNGVGMGIKPEPVYLKPGDVVTLGIDGLGNQEQVCVASRELADSISEVTDSLAEISTRQVSPDRHERPRFMC